MEDFANNLVSEYWWLSVVVVSVVINLLSAYLFKHMDNSVSKAFSWWRMRSESRAKKFQLEVAALRENYFLLHVYFHAESRERFRALTSMVIAILCLVLVSIARSKSPVDPTTLFGFEVHLLAERAVGFLGLFSLAMSLASQARAIRLAETVSEAMRTRGKLNS